MKNDHFDNKFRFYVSLAFFAVFAAAFVYTLYTQNAFNSDAHRGQFGDMFGGLNAVFSGLAFVGLIATIVLQRRDLQLQQQELSDTRAVLKGQQKAMEAQLAVIDKQAFESKFFQTLSLLSGVSKEVDAPDQNEQSRGKSAFRSWLTELTNRTNQNKNLSSLQVYEDMYKAAAPTLGQYYRTLYNCIKLIDKSEAGEPSFYSNLVRAQMADDEASILFYNGLSVHGSQKFKPLIERYALLKMMRAEVITSWEDLNAYSPAAFGSRYEEITSLVEQRLGPSPSKKSISDSP